MSTIQTITLASLPAVGAEFEGGLFAGVTTQRDGKHVAVILLPNKTDELNWQQAKDWAAEVGGELPNRPIAALLFANLKPQFEEEWHWTSEEHSASYAWLCGFNHGTQFGNRKSYEGSARAVRLIHLDA